MPTLTNNDLSMIRANANKIILEMRSAGSTGGVSTLYRNVCGAAAAILKLTDPHNVNEPSKVTPLRRREAE